MNFLTLVILVTVEFTSGQSFAHDFTADKLNENSKQAVKATEHTLKKAGRAASDAACPLVNGKAKCALKKVKHKVENTTDEFKN